MNSINTLDTQRKLNEFYVKEMSSPCLFASVPSRETYEDIFTIEDGWESYELSRIDLGDIPKTKDTFVDWYHTLHKKHKVELEDFFNFLAEQANLEEIAYYVCMEEMVDGRFDDVIALAQIGLDGGPKIALAENYWDEMGHGKQSQMHTLLFSQSADYMKDIIKNIEPTKRPTATVEALKNGNILLKYALRRKYSARLIGALAILEHTAPYRFSQTVAGMRRLTIPESVIYYHELHIDVDAAHGEALLNRVILPLIDQNIDVIKEIAIGAKIRYSIALDYYRSIEQAFKTLN